MQYFDKISASHPLLHYAKIRHKHEHALHVYSEFGRDGLMAVMRPKHVVIKVK
jgi:hypothetical protein